MSGRGFGGEAVRPEIMADVEAFNALPDDAAMRELLACCSSQSWAASVAAGRPYPDAAHLLAASDAAVAAMTEQDLRQALAGHPRIGDRPAGPDGAWSRQEQAGVAAADHTLLQELADGNASYERRFGHIYLVCASGRSATELLAYLRQRLGNDAETEWRIVAAELAKINQIRLRKLIGAPA